MSDATRICGIFGDDVQHLHGNLYRVRRSRIGLAKSGLSVEDGRLVYGNPRWYVNKDGKPEARGINESSKMEELRNSIQEDGLENPFRIRVLEGDEPSLEVVNGERRFRCLDVLCSNDSLCKDSSTGELGSASEIYEWVDCRVDFMDDATALGVALRPNETSEVIGDLANINVVRVLRESGYDDQEILRATGKSISWLRETETIIGLDDVCFEHFQSEKISRKVALHLALIENAEERLDLLEKLKENAEARHAERMKDVSKKMENARQTQEIQAAAAEWAAKEGDEEASKEHSKKAKKAESRARAASEEHSKISSKPATANSKDLGKVTKSGPLSHSKIQSIYVNLLSSLVENDGVTDPDENGECYSFDVATLSAILATLQAIMNGNKNAVNVLAECVAGVESSDEVTEDEDEDISAEAEDEEDEDEDEDEDISAEADDEENEEDEDEDISAEADEEDEDDDDDDDDGDAWDEDASELSDDLVREFEDELASMGDESDDE